MSLVVHILTDVFVVLFMLWLSRARLRRRPYHERDILAYPPILLVFGIIYLLLFLGFAVLILLTTSGAERLKFFLLSVAFSLGGLPIIAASLFEKHRVSALGIEYSPLLGVGSGGYLPWSEVRRVKFSSFMRWFILEGYDGTKVRISVMMMGLPEFARYLLASVAPEAIEARALHLLQQTAYGFPPRLWG